MIKPNTFKITETEASQTIAAVIRKNLTSTSWKIIKKMIEAGQTKINGQLCLDPARRVKLNDEISLLSKPENTRPDKSPLTIRHLDEHLVVVEKPAMINTVRHPLERDWTETRKSLSPTLEDLTIKAIHETGKLRKAAKSRLRVVQRLDKETSGLLVFARTVEAERGLGKQFHQHSVERKYLALVPGLLMPQTIESYLVRDRGDGRRGSLENLQQGKIAITHVTIVERLNGFTLMGCKLETGRTHQIRIHLAEKGHPVCGDRVYRNTVDGKLLPDGSGFPRVALHAAELGFIHPISGQKMHWTMDMPEDLQKLITRLRK